MIDEKNYLNNKIHLPNSSSTINIYSSDLNLTESDTSLLDKSLSNQNKIDEIVKKGNCIMLNKSQRNTIKR